MEDVALVLGAGLSSIYMISSLVKGEFIKPKTFFGVMLGLLWLVIFCLIFHELLPTQKETGEMTKTA